MGTIQKFNRLAVVCLLALAAAFLSASTPLMAGEPAASDQVRLGVPAPEQNPRAGQDPAAQDNQDKEKKPQQENSDGAKPATPDAKPVNDALPPGSETASAGNDAAPGVPPPPAAPVPYKQDFTRPAEPSDGPLFGGAFWRRILRDEKTIWLSPFHMHASDAMWAAPLVGGTAALIPFDHRLASGLPNTSSQVNISKKISLLGSPMGSMGIAAGTLLLGKFTHNDKTRETGMMLSEALIHANIVMNVMKLASGRQRPVEGDGTGAFWHFGNESFPSGHSMSAWAMAAVFAHQYGDEHQWAPFMSYGLATAVSLSRLGGQRHFPSDVLAGSALGYLMGRFVYRRHEADRYAREQKWKKHMPEIAPSMAHGGVGVSLKWQFGN